MTHVERQKSEEKTAMEILLAELHANGFEKSESPDARICYNGKQIGIEVVGYHRDKDNKEANATLDKSLEKYGKAINERGERGIEISVLIDDEQAPNYTSAEEKHLFEAIENRRNGNDVFNQYVMGITIRQTSPDERCSVLRDGGATCEEVDVELVNKLIAKKEKKLQGYKKLPQNNFLEEYWLIIYVDCFEYDYFERISFQLPKETAYNRIYLTHLTDGVLRIK